MRKELLVLATVLLVAFIAAAGATAAPPDQGYSRPADANIGGPDVIPVGCQALHGGSVTVPAGEPFTVWSGWGAKTFGEIHEWVDGTTNTLSIDGGSPIDMSPYFLGPTHEWLGPTDPNWSDIFAYQLPALAAGQSETIVYYAAINHTMDDGYNVYQPSSTTYTCTVTGA
jgi:hypothetical protein